VAAPGRRRRAGFAAALLAIVAAGAVWGPGWLAGRAAPRPDAQRALAGGTSAGPNALPLPTFDRVRVVLVDGLGAADTARVPAFGAVCARGLELTVDVGFPTKSVPVQQALWTGLTADQLGAPLVPDGALPPAASLALRVPRSAAVVETYGAIAAGAGFAVLPDATADSWTAAAVPTNVAAWRTAGFDAAIQDVVASDRRLVLVHLLGVDEAAHDGGRSGAAYDAALRSADARVALAARATPGNSLLVVLSDHGHLPGGGHGDAEPPVRLVRACLAPSPLTLPAHPEHAPTADPEHAFAEAERASRDASTIHLVDLSRALADALGVAPDPRSVGRPLAVAITHPDPDATLPRPSGARWTLALLLAAIVIALGALRLGRAAWVWSWPLAAYALHRAILGAPSLSAVPSPLASIAIAAPIVALVIVALRRHGAAAIAIATAAPAAMLAAVFAILSRVPDAIVTGAAPRVPTWTAHLAWSAPVAALAFAIAAVALLCPDRGRSAATSDYPIPRDRGQNGL
jgi:hypothetical protein